jgi:metallo-beta-lactamase family protein
MRIQFCGANRTVTGSCHLIEVNGLKIFLDMGMYQGSREEARRLNNWLPDDAVKADCIILSHGHLDHCGKIPVLTRAGYAGPIYCTPATAEVARIVLEDSAGIQEEDDLYLNRRTRGPGEPPLRPLYTRADIPRVLSLMQTIAYDRKVDLGNNVAFTFHDAGHILGSAYIILHWQENGSSITQTLLFTADVGRYNTPIIRDPQPLPHPVDHVITESTYGGKTHAPMSEVGPQLLENVRYCIQRRSRLLVPSFAVGRTQTILWYLQRFIQEGLIASLPIYVDSPMGTEVSEIHSRFRDNYDEETRRLIGQKDLFGTSRVTFTRSAEESRRINSDPGPCVIVASSPTCEFGRILHHLKQSVERPHDVVVFVGWTPPHTLGRRLQDGEKRVRIFDRWYEVACKIETIHGLSAHADGGELVQFLSPTLRPQTRIYVVHGEPDQAEILAQRILSAGAGPVAVPALETAVMTV